MESLLIGLDIGTSSVKAGLFDASGNLLAKACAPLVLYSPEPGWAEQEPEDWWQGSRRVLAEILRGVDPGRVTGLGLSGQCPGHVLVDGETHPLGRAIIWRDLRARAEADWIASRITDAQAQEWIGTDQPGQAGSPPARLLWLAKNRREDWQRSVKVLQPKDYVALRLTGSSLATDCHSAYCLANPETSAYERRYFDILGLSLEKMPSLFDPTAVVGEVTSGSAQQTGLKAGTRVVIGTIDAYCDNLAGGVIFDGRAVDVAGTSEIVSLGIDRKVQARGVYPAKIGADGWFLCGPTQAGGDTLRWLAGCFYPEFGGGVHFDKMEEQANAVPAGSEGLVFLPYLSGERAPIWDADARGVFFGLTINHDRRHFTRAVYEGLGFAIRHILEIAEAAAGRSAGEMVVCGGGSQSGFWNQVKADILQKPVRPTAVNETGCLGAAILAGVGTGLHPDLRAGCERMIVFKDLLLPRKELAGVYERAYRTYRQLYPAVKPVFPKAGR
jgi:xylulokinase